MQRNSKQLSTRAGRVGPAVAVVSGPAGLGRVGIIGWQASPIAQGCDR